MRCKSAVIAVAFVTLSSGAGLAQAEAGPEVAPVQPVEAVPTTPPVAPPPAVPDEPAPATPPVTGPNPEPAPATPPVTAPNPLPPSPAETGPTPQLPSSSSVPPVALPAPTAPAPTSASAARPQERRSAATLTIVNGRAVPATTVAVLVGAKAVTRSGPLAPNARITLKLPSVQGCRVSVVASFPGWYSAITRGKINVCKTGLVVVRL